MTSGGNTHTRNRFTALWILSATIQVSRYQKKHSPSGGNNCNNFPENKWTNFLHFMITKHSN